MTKNERQLREQMGAALDEMKALTAKAEAENRQLTDAELQSHLDAYDKAQALSKQIEVLTNERSIEASAKSGVPAMAEPTQKMTEKQNDQELRMYTAKILTVAASKSMDYSTKMKHITEAQEKLAAAGHYRAAADGYNTLVDTDGGIFLPTTVSDEVFDLARQYGVFTRYANRFPTGGGRLKIPNIMGDLTFSAVNETSDILVDEFQFKGLELDDLKWGLFLPWSNEIEGLRGAQLVSIFISKLAEAYAKLVDNVAINGNGTSTFHNIKGLIAMGGNAQYPWVRKSAAASSNNTFAKVTAADWNNARKDVAPSLISTGFYVAHPHRQIELLNELTKGDGANPIKWVTFVGDQMFVHGRPIYFTESFPNTDGSNVPYAAYVDGRYVAVADAGGFVTELFSEATIKTKSGGTINLASQDMKALRVKAFMDMEFGNATVTDGGVQRGAFTVLYTA